MERRGFFKRIFSAIAALAAPRWMRAQTPPAETSMRELAAIVLPASLGRARTDRIAGDFLRWLRDYHAGAEIGSGYGNPRTQVVPANPSARYVEQIGQLEMTRAGVEKSLQDAKIDRIPQRPNGRHVAADLLAYFYGSANGEDFLYNAAIKRDDCRGLDTSTKRPPALT